MSFLFLAVTIIASGVAMCFADWIFMGMLAHKHYAAYPDVWRLRQGESETLPIVKSSLLNLVTAGFFAGVCRHLKWNALHTTTHLALAIWIIAALPILLNDGVWMKVRPAATGWFVVGWLVKLELAAAAVAWLLR